MRCAGTAHKMLVPVRLPDVHTLDSAAGSSHMLPACLPPAASGLRTHATLLAKSVDWALLRGGGAPAVCVGVREVGLGARVCATPEDTPVTNTLSPLVGGLRLAALCVCADYSYDPNDLSPPQPAHSCKCRVPTITNHMQLDAHRVPP